MKTYFKKMIFVSSLLVTTMQLCYAELPEIESRSNLSCMMGGVGQNESESMRVEARKWPLAIEFSERLGKSDAWISGAQLSIINAKGVTIFDEPCNGPMFLARLAPGKYHLIASYQGVTKTRAVEIKDGKHIKESFNWQN